MRKLLFLLMMIPVILAAQTVQMTDYISAPSMNRQGEFTNDFIVSDVGAPMVPFEGYQLIVPHGHRVTGVNVEFSGYVSMSGRYDVACFTQPVHTLMTSIPETPRDEAIYGADTAYPAKAYDLVSVERLAGVDIALVNVYPYKYHPQSGVMGYYSQINVSLETEYDSEIAYEQSQMICRAPHIEQRLQKLVRNMDMLRSYPAQNSAPLSRMVDVNNPFDFVIVCSEDFEDTFHEYVQWKAEHGVHAGVFTIEDIYSNYPGMASNKLREFVKDAYTTWANTDHPLQYLLLAGDDEIIPIRGMYGFVNELDTAIPADIYYGCLDGDWNADGDQYFGEANDNPDLYAEVHVGRFPGDTQEDFENMIYKTISYLDYPTAAIDNCTLVGEQLDEDPTYGGDYKDAVVADNRLPSYYDVVTLYERDGTFSGNNPEALIEIIEADDAGLINHMGHCDYNYAMGIVPSQARMLDNTEYPFLYSQGCYAMAWDQQTSGDVEAIGENFLTSDGGMFAFVGNSRYGWYAHSSTNGASQRYDIKYFDGLFDEEIRNLGACLSYSKESIASNINAGGGTYRWLYYCINLFGDPEVTLINGQGMMPDLDILSVEVTEGQGDGDGVLNPGEQAELIVSLMCLPNDGPALNVQADFFPADNNTSIVSGSGAMGNMNPGDVFTNTTPFVVQMADNCPVGKVKVGMLVTANDGTTFRYAKRFFIDVDVELYLAGYPFVTGNSFQSSPAVVDYDNNGVKELFNVNTAGEIYGLDASGATLTGFPVSTGANVRTSMAMGNVDSDPNYEFVVAGFNRALVIVDHDGTILYNSTDYGIFMSTPALADITGDGVCEIIIGDMNSNLHVLDGSGNEVGAFPVAMPERILSGVSVADIDNDGAREIVFGCFDGKLYAVEPDGSMVSGYPVTLSGQIQNSTCVFGDGVIAVTSSDNHLYVVVDGAVITDVTMPGRISKTQIPADFDGDDVYELAFALENGAQYIVELDGTPLAGWPIALGTSSVASPVAADLDQDGYPDYIIDDNVGTVHAWNYTGAYLPSFPIVSERATDGSTICVDDLTNDYTPDLTVGTTGGVAVFDIKYDKGLLNVWRTFRGNIWRDGSTATIHGTGDPSVPAFVTELGANYPNPFNPETTVAFSLSSEDARNPVSLKVYNVRGQLVKTLVNGNLEEGRHEIVWRGHDEAGNAVGSGVYFTRMVTGRKVSTRKMLLLK